MADKLTEDELDAIERRLEHVALGPTALRAIKQLRAELARLTGETTRQLLGSKRP